MQRLIFVLGWCLCWAATVAADEPKGKSADVSSAAVDPVMKKDLRRLLELTEAAKLSAQAMREMMKLQQATQKFPRGFLEEFDKEITEEALLEIFIPVYAKYLEPGDVKALIAFYETPAGRRFIRNQPKMLQESMQAGAKFGAAAGFRAGLRAARKQQQLKKNEEQKQL